MKTRVIFGTVILILALPLAALCQQQQAGGLQRHRISLPSKDWALDVEIPAPLTVLEEISKDGRKRSFMALYVDKKNILPMEIVVSFMPAQAAGGGAAFRELVVTELHKSQGIPKGEIKTSEYNQIPVVRYKLDSRPLLTGMAGTAPVWMDFKLGRSMTASAYLAKDDVWIELVVTGQSDKEIERSFHRLLDSARIVDTSAPSTSFDYFEKGRSLYLLGDARAFGFYTKALELERRERRLDDVHWRTLVRELADAYVATGDTAKAREVLEYGLAHDARHPWFHYYMARVHASQGDLDNTIASLEKAFLNKGKSNNKLTVILYDPLRDPKFERFHKDERFRKAVKKMR